MKPLTKFLNRISHWQSLVVFLVLYLIFPLYILKNAEAKINTLAGKVVGIIDLSFAFNTQKTWNMLAEYGKEARAYYAYIEMTTDLAYPVVYAFLFGIILTLLYRNKQYNWVNAIPFITMLFDFCENATIIYLLNSFPEKSDMVLLLCEIFKLLKWICFASIILLILWGVLMLLFKKKIATQ